MKDKGQAEMTEGAVIQVFSALATNIGCMVGPEMVWKALEFILQHKQELGRSVMQMRAGAPKGVYPS